MICSIMICHIFIDVAKLGFPEPEGDQWLQEPSHHQYLVLCQCGGTQSTSNGNQTLCEQMYTVVANWLL